RFWSNFTDVPAIDIDTGAIGDTWLLARDGVLTALRQKQNAPLERIQLSDDLIATLIRYNHYQDQISILNDRLSKTTFAIRLVKEQAAAGNLSALEADVERLKSMRARYTSTVEPLCVDYLAAQAAKFAVEQRREAARTALDQYRQRVFPIYQ